MAGRLRGLAAVGRMHIIQVETKISSEVDHPPGPDMERPPIEKVMCFFVYTHLCHRVGKSTAHPRLQRMPISESKTRHAVCQLYPLNLCSAWANSVDIDKHSSFPFLFADIG